MFLPLTLTLSISYKKDYSLSRPLVGQRGACHCHSVTEAHISQASYARSLTSFPRGDSTAGLFGAAPFPSASPPVCDCPVATGAGPASGSGLHVRIMGELLDTARIGLGLFHLAHLGYCPTSAVLPSLGLLRCKLHTLESTLFMCVQCLEF